MRTYDVVLTNVADAAKLIYGLFAETGTNRGLQTKSVAYGGDQSKPGRILIGDGVHGSGQKVAVDSQAYQTGTQLDATLPGHLRTSPQSFQADTTIDAAYPNAGETARGSVVSALGKTFLITPLVIYELSGAPLTYTVVSSDTVAALHRFTGSYAVFADRIFFGTEVLTTRVSGTCRVWTATTVWANSGFTGSYFSIVGSRMFVASNAATNPRVSVKWTDEQGNSNPLMSTAYTYPTDKYAMDAAHLGPALIVALASSQTEGLGEVITLDIGGAFTNLVEGFNCSGVEQFVPFNGGQIALVRGPLSNSLFFASLDVVSPLPVHPNASTELNILFEAITLGAVKRLIASEIDRVIIGHVGTLGTGVVTLVIDESGRVRGHDAALPASLTEQVGSAKVLAARIVDDGTGRVLEVFTLDSSSDIKSALTPLYDGITPYPLEPPGLGNEVPTSGGYWQSSKYPIDGYELAQILAVGGRVELLNDANASDEELAISINGSVVGTLTKAAGTLTTAGNDFRIELDEAITTRAVQLSFAFTDTDVSGVMVDVMTPLYVDYVTIPNQYEEVTMNFTIGSLQVNRTGGFTKQSQATVMAALSDACQNPSVWNAVFENGDSWKVIPLRYQVQDVEASARGGEGMSVVSLVCKRLRDTGRVLT